MSDLSRNSQQWWEATTKTVAQWYNEHMNLSPFSDLAMHQQFQKNYKNENGSGWKSEQLPYSWQLFQKLSKRRWHPKR